MLVLKQWAGLLCGWHCRGHPAVIEGYEEGAEEERNRPGGCGQERGGFRGMSEEEMEKENEEKGNQQKEIRNMENKSCGRIKSKRISEGDHVMHVCLFLVSWSSCRQFAI